MGRGEIGLATAPTVLGGFPEEPEVAPGIEERYVIEIPETEVGVVVKNGGASLDEETLKNMIWEANKETIFKSMKVHQQCGNKSELEKANQRLFLLDQISEVQRQFLQKKEPKAVFGYLLSGLLDLMDSEYGFIGQIKYEPDGTKYLQTHAITNIAWNQATRQFYEENADAGLKFYNLDSLFGHVMVHAEPVIANNPYNDSRACGIPEGHPPLNHFLGIPFFESGGVTMNGMVGIANKPGGYCQEDIDFLEPFTVTCSNLIQAYGAMQENVRLIDTLEEKVKERTSELELANVRLEKANRRVVEASAAQLKNFACMSHEIRTPLNCIVGLSSLLLETDLDPQQSDSMRMIVTSSELLAAIVNDVLDYSKLISGNVEIDIQPTDIQATLDAVVHSIEIKGKDRNLRLRTDYDPLVPKIIDTDGRRLQQILYNLLGNAIKFSKDNGVVELAIKIVEHDDNGNSGTTVDECPHSSPVLKRQLTASTESPSSSPGDARPTRCPFHKPSKLESDDSTISSTSSSGSGCPITKAQKAAGVVPGKKKKRKKSLRFVVKDYGKGIDDADFDKIFKPFMQASGETETLYGGTGLGLAITAKLVEGLGGTVSVNSILGEWSEFTVDLPFEREFADVDGLSKLLSDMRIMIVNQDKNQGLSPTLVDAYKLNAVEFENCQELKILGQVKGAIDKGRTYLCLVHEDLYHHDDLSVFTNAAAGTTVLTFGPQYTVKDSFSRGHYRSLVHLLPSAFVDSLVQAKFSAAELAKAQAAAAKAQAAQASAAEAASPPSPSLEPPKYDEMKILIAEDNLINQKVLTNMLKRCGVKHIDIVDNGKLAVERTATHTDYDVILMDMQMPVMGGVEATRLIVSRGQQPGAKPPPKVVFVTANAMESFEQEARDAGATGYICKPFNLKKIESFLLSFHNDYTNSQ